MLNKQIEAILASSAIFGIMANNHIANASHVHKHVNRHYQRRQNEPLLKTYKIHYRNPKKRSKHKKYSKYAKLKQQLLTHEHRYEQTHQKHQQPNHENNNVAKYIKRKEFQLVNQDRAQENLAPLHHQRLIQKIANKRIRELSPKHMGHFNQYNESYAAIDAAHLGRYNWYNDHDTAENVQNSYMDGKNNDYSRGMTEKQLEQHGTTKQAEIVRARSRYQEARNINQMFDNPKSDALSNDGHRKNIMNPKYRYLGISTKYQPHDKQMFITEEFSD